jgi:NAD/NADP transhydrogenase beta subunit
LGVLYVLMKRYNVMVLCTMYILYNNASNDDSVDGMAGMPLKHTLHKEDEVLVRLKVDHTGFAAVNNEGSYIINGYNL